MKNASVLRLSTRHLTGATFDELREDGDLSYFRPFSPPAVCVGHGLLVHSGLKSDGSGLDVDLLSAKEKAGLFGLKYESVGNDEDEDEDENESLYTRFPDLTAVCAYARGLNAEWVFFDPLSEACGDLLPVYDHDKIEKPYIPDNHLWKDVLIAVTEDGTSYVLPPTGSLMLLNGMEDDLLVKLLSSLGAEVKLMGEVYATDVLLIDPDSIDQMMSAQEPGGRRFVFRDLIVYASSDHAQDWFFHVSEDGVNPGAPPVPEALKVTREVAKQENVSWVRITSD